jgi:hypothetical protein
LQETFSGGRVDAEIRRSGGGGERRSAGHRQGEAHWITGQALNVDAGMVRW